MQTIKINETEFKNVVHYPFARGVMSFSMEKNCASDGFGAKPQEIYPADYRTAGL
jgi:hypothetical protein